MGHDENNDQKTSSQPKNETEMPLTKTIARIEEGNEDNGAIAKENRRKKSSFTNSPNLRKYLIIGGIILIVLVLLIFLLVSVLNPSAIEDQPFTQDDKPLKLKIIPNAEVPQGPSSSTLHVFEKAAICSDSTVCNEVAKKILQKGGNVVDSAIAALLCTGIVTLQSMGIGGGGLMNIFIKSKNVAYTIDFREVAPLAAKENMFSNLPINASYHSPLSIAVPGELKGYHEAFIRFGSMEWKDLVEPSIKICEDGYEMSQHMNDVANIDEMSIRKDEYLREMLIDKTTDKIHRVGAHIYPPKKLCQTYRMLAENGALDFYDGELAKLVIEDLKDIGSIIVADDLKVYSADFIHSISVNLNEDIMYVVPPVGSGVITANMLNIMNGYKFTNESVSGDNETVLTMHRMAEAFKFAYAKRYDLGDLRFNRNLGDLISNLSSPYYGDELRKQIDDDVTYDDSQHYGAKFFSKISNGTSHLSFLGPNGDAVAVTSSINYYFGCGVTGNRTGISFNSGMEDYSKPGVANIFHLPSAAPNFIAPRKRAMSSMSPTIVTDRNGNVKIVIGAAGGSKIPTALAQIIARVLWFGQDIKQAIDAPRIHHQLFPNILGYDYGVIQNVIDGLEERGHSTERFTNRTTVACGIVKNSTAIYANADYRKVGDVSGF